MRPFFRYFGAKWRLAAHYPPDPKLPIVEPFAGGAGYSCRYGEGREVVLVERNPEVVALWAWLISAKSKEILSLPVEEVHAGVDIRTLGLRPEAEGLIGRWLNSHGAIRWRMSALAREWAATTPSGLWSDATKRRIASQLRHIRGWRLIAGDYTQAPDIAANWHIDPPYQLNAYGKGQYKHEDLDYPALGLWCRARKGLVMVHEQEGADWLPFANEISASTGRPGGKQTEVCWLQNPKQLSLFT